MRRVGAVTLLCLLTTPGVAAAATVSSVKQEARGVVVTFAGEPGEDNRPQLRYDRRAETVTLTDAAGPVQAEAPCTAANGAATCSIKRCSEFGCQVDPPVNLRFVLADGDDVLQFEPPEVPGRTFFTVLSARMGPGADRADTVPVRELDGGPGDDTLTTPAGGAEVLGGEGADTITGAASGYQVLAGGPGVDTIDGGEGTPFNQRVSFADATEPVTAVLGSERMGPAGEEDLVRNVSGVIGGAGDDTLTGDDDLNQLVGGAGDDTIAGGDGGDRIVPGEGSDQVDGGGDDDFIQDRGTALTPDAVLDGGEGDDKLVTVGTAASMLGGRGADELKFDTAGGRIDGGAGRDEIDADTEFENSDGITCGAGRDEVQSFGRAVVPADCESYLVYHFKITTSIPNRVRFRSGVLVVGAFDLRGRDEPRVTLFAGRRRLARARAEDGRVRFALDKAAERALGRVGAATFLFEAKDNFYGESPLVTIALPG